MWRLPAWLELKHRVRVRAHATARSHRPSQKIGIPGCPAQCTACRTGWRVECPFDMNEFSPEIPWDENAAPLYLAAIAEFSPEVATCFPPDQRERIALQARERTDHYSTFMGAGAVIRPVS